MEHGITPFKTDDDMQLIKWVAVSVREGKMMEYEITPFKTDDNLQVIKQVAVSKIIGTFISNSNAFGQLPLSVCFCAHQLHFIVE